VDVPKGVVTDALGAPYKFNPSQGITLAGTSADMAGGGGFGWKSVEQTDDTSVAIPMLQTFRDLERHHGTEHETEIVWAWRRWARTATDVGNQTPVVQGMFDAESTVADARAAATAVHHRQVYSGVNGSLMRTAPMGIMDTLARANLFSPSHTVSTVVHTARALSDLTHYDQDAGDACVL